MWSKRSPRSVMSSPGSTTLIGRRLVLRPLVVGDFESWREVRRRCHDWLTKWEPSRIPGAPDSVENRQAFAARCGARAREIQLGTGYGFGIFVDGYFAGEININSIHRGAFQSAYVGYWIDQQHAGQSYMPEAVVLVLRFGFEQLGLHRLQISIIPRNTPSRRVVEKLELRAEGVAERYLEINGVWEDHMRFAITSEEWEQRRDELVGSWAY
jgi:ribosomal-protein-alanine N-acetyltransferase